MLQRPRKNSRKRLQFKQKSNPGVHRTMESQTATHHDAEIILKLYDLRREEVMRKARHWLAFEFKPKTVEDIFAVVQNTEAKESAYYRQVISYWEMAASLVLRGAVNADLFLDTQGEGLFFYAKFYAFHEEIQARTGRPFMRHTAQMLEKFPAARTVFDTIMKAQQPRAS
jgi:hypothetical protein